MGNCMQTALLAELDSFLATRLVSRRIADEMLRLDTPTIRAIVVIMMDVPNVTPETRRDHFGSANSVTTATVATTVCINTSTACALGVTPANLCDLVKLSRSGSANESASAQTATNRNILSGCAETALRTA